MAHYALIDENNIVTNVISGCDEGGVDWEFHYANEFSCTVKRTSYNTYENEHLDGGTPFRKNFAAIGYTWDESRNAFIAPKPFDEFVFDEVKCAWRPPYSQPAVNSAEGFYYWDHGAYLADNNNGWSFSPAPGE